MRDEVDLAFEMNLESLLDQIGVEGVRLLSCWVHKEGGFDIKGADVNSNHSLNRASVQCVD